MGTTALQNYYYENRKDKYFSGTAAIHLITKEEHVMNKKKDFFPQIKIPLLFRKL